MNTPITEDELHAHADGRLDAARQAEVEAWLSAHPERRAEVDAWRAQGALLHRQFDQVLDEPIPARFTALAVPSARPWFDARIAAALGGVMVGVLAGYLLRGQATMAPAMASLPRQAAVAHAVYVPEVRHPVEVGADQQAHLVTWLSKRLGSELKPPVLDSVGYQLVGGRLLPGDSQGVAQFMYENAAKSRLTLYVRPDTATVGSTGFRYARENGVDVFYWVDGRFGYALSGTTGREDMLRLATLVYRAPSPLRVIP